MSVKAIEKSSNIKTGPVSVTMATFKSCPQDCPMADACYGKAGPQGIHSRRLDRETADNVTPEDIATMEAEAIDSLTGDRDLRVHVTGDCRTSAAAEIVSQAMKRHENKNGRSSWTYTHAWRDVPVSSWNGVSVLASCETAQDVMEARAAGYATALVVERFESKKAYPIADGVAGVPCPNQTHEGITCVDCRLCMKNKKDVTILFEAHGALRKKAPMVSLMVVK